MKTAEYRDLIDEVAQSRLTLMASVGSHEQRVSWLRLRDKVEVLKSAQPRTPKLADLEKARRVVEMCETLLGQMKARFDEADAAYSRMAFAGEWR